MEKIPSAKPRYLEEDPTLEQRWQALRLNVQTCYERLTRASNKDIFQEAEVMGAQDHMTIASVNPLQIGTQLDHLLAWYREQKPLQEVICWYLHPAPPKDLEALLLARGFAPNWQAHWMWCDLRHLSPHHNRPANLDIRVSENELAWEVDDLPYYDPQDVPNLAALHNAYPQHSPALLAFQHQQIVGRCMLNFTMGQWGIAGLFAMGVVPSARKQGIGTALAHAACKLAQQMGCHHVVLNATPLGEPVYRRVGFQSMGYTDTWLLPSQTLAALAPSTDEVRFLEAVGQGEIPILDTIGNRLEKRIFHETLPGGLMSLDIAVRCHQPAAAAWLVAHGAPLDILSAWDLGWKDQIPGLLATQPELVNLQRGQWQATPLHIAIERDDLELVKLLLTVPNDLEIKDAVFQATALDWAHHFQRDEIIQLLENHRLKSARKQ
ncbi:GNAT family N-acetyltransferase [Ktedonosporobacter rubrisoli]|uniref:GNAT family N-acetyltransferase n=1 Tax=Ktedonosporobacter rubrisoli TaxID=2509675 RepID=A0A4P6JIF7_KTERU|nr:GNAT family N-acetyltransferase [Ktedonosporobacter rubrisoli]QBD74838.1 GNAT family N-acetyltransferase [Ktedonosporobacter rubrisoli]